MHAFVLLQVALDAVESTSELLWERPGVIGIEELPADGSALFPPDAAHNFAKFDPVEAERLTAWLRREEFRKGDTEFLKVYLDTPLLPWIDQFVQDHPTLKIINQGTLESIDYMAAVREQFRGREIGQTLWVGPPWQTPPAGKIPVIIEPGMAFGLGDHPTTQMCLEALERLTRIDFRPERIFDIGTGTGVLAIAARKLFPAADLWLSDTDPICAGNVARNFALNQLPLPTHVFFDKTATLDQIAAPAHGFDLVTSNVYLDALKALTPQVTALLRPESHWIVSGLSGDEQLNDFIAAAEKHFPIIDISRTPPWSALVLQT